VTKTGQRRTNIQDNIIKGQFDDIVGDLLGYTPTLDDLVDFSSGLLRDLVQNRRVWWIKGLETLLLDTCLQKLLVTLNLGRTTLDLL
jgi:hypothetical protein